MGFAENRTPETQGKREMHELVRATFAALQDGELDELVHDLRVRVFGRDPDALLETTIENGVCRWSFKPMVELMLRHVLDVAAHDRRPADERRRDIAATIELAGF